MILSFFGILCLGVFMDDFIYDLMNRNKNKVLVIVGGIVEVVFFREIWVKIVLIEMKVRIVVDIVFSLLDMRMVILYVILYMLIKIW